jgi:hypothetical protein
LGQRQKARQSGRALQLSDRANALDGPCGLSGERGRSRSVFPLFLWHQVYRHLYLMADARMPFE